MTRIVMDPGWEDNVLAGWDRLAEDRLGPDIAGDARRYAPVGPSWVNPDPGLHRRTPPARVGGELKASIEHHLDGHTLIVAARAPYAAYVEEGTRPHTITARGGWSLWSPLGGGAYFGHQVHHPGTRPQPFLRAALYQHRGP